jgi:Tetratricopeptide repeat
MIRANSSPAGAIEVSSWTTPSVSPGASWLGVCVWQNSVAVPGLNGAVLIHHSALCGFRSRIRIRGRKSWLAIADYSAALALEPASLGVLLNRAKAYVAQHDLEHAREDLQAALRLDPHLASAKSALDDFEMPIREQPGS